MVRVTIDDEVCAKLLATSPGEVIELIDRDGKLVGRVVPEISSATQDIRTAKPQLSEEEIDRLADYDGPGITTDELLRRLRSQR